VGRKDVVEATVVFNGNIAVPLITDVKVIAGSDKFHWPRLASGEKDSVTLKPEPDDDRQLTLLFTIAGQQKSWTGPQVGNRVGYRLIMTIGPDGQVAGRHCLLPCRLD